MAEQAKSPLVHSHRTWMPRFVNGEEKSASLWALHCHSRENGNPDWSWIPNQVGNDTIDYAPIGLGCPAL